ncbi:Hypothetical predicted protein [Olea europaea subsp. europaea]|uniref:Uncharacterized protein n=1 Tax=Olea europaea subsp. europaea TaxID=158383 RepID=A0A8S0UA93_OLEEU|nr:Hypothetical predicted protein [Olea europaea subsp. europaea]
MVPKKAILYLLLSLFIIYDVASMVTATVSNDTTQATVETNKVNTNTSKIPDFVPPIRKKGPKSSGKDLIELRKKFKYYVLGANSKN